MTGLMGGINAVIGERVPSRRMNDRWECCAGCRGYASFNAVVKIADTDPFTTEKKDQP
ncbi:hypothetical protein [Bosea sp. PAMC 26642]|uniref:hypothetical protein n=1 Tax=Bosea sp. (strain PAMC 26642) TaxID=1792307 RepID=UPI0012E787E9|nr:hypothetical protein [Bosea sp. PAMC 26642]